MKSQVFSLPERLSAQTLCCQSDRPISGPELLQHVALFQASINAFLRQQNKTCLRWLIHCDESYPFCVTFLALLGLNQRVVLSANLQPHWLKEIQSGFDVVVTTNSVDSTIKILQEDLSTDIFPLSLDSTKPEQNLSEQAVSPPLQLHFGGDEEVIFYTSGSTGKPKAISKPLSALLSEVESLERTFGAKMSRTAMVAGSVSHLHIYGLLFKILWPLCTGRCWLESMIEFPEQLVPLNNRELVFIGSPAFLSRLDTSLDYPSCKTVFSSGGPLSYEASCRVNEALGNRPIEVYGSTETGGIGYRQQHQSNTPWQLFDCHQLSQQGELIYLTSGYLKQSKIPLDDNIQLLDASHFHLLGRRDRIVKIAEKRVSLDEMENWLRQHPTVADCRLVTINDRRASLGAVLVIKETLSESMRQHPAEVVQDRQQKSAIVGQLRTFLRQRFDAVTIPRKWRMVTHIPVNSQGKYDQQALMALFNRDLC